MKQKSLALGVAVAAAIVCATQAPARADYSFLAPVATSFISLLPDKCIPIGSSAYCISFTTASYMTAIQALSGQTQIGQMASQNLATTSIKQLSDAGVADPTGTDEENATCTARNVDPGTGQPDDSTAGDAAAKQVLQRVTVMQTLQNSVVNAAFNYSSGHLSAAQLELLMSVRHEVEAHKQLCVAAAQQQQNEQQARKTVDYSGAILDLTNTTDPSASWNI